MVKNSKPENQYLFHELVRKGDATKLEEAIVENDKHSYNPFGNNLSLNDVDNLGISPMHMSIMTRNIECLRVCIQHGCDKTLHCERTPPLLLLCHSLSTAKDYDTKFAEEAFNLLYIDRAICDYTDKLGRTVFHLAAAYGLLDILQLAYEKEKKSLELKDNDGNTVLHYACKNDQVEASEWIISKDAELLLSKNKYDQTPLHTCLYSAALNTYAMIRRSHAVSLPLQEEDAFHHTPIHMFKSILQRTREMGEGQNPHERHPLGLYVSDGNDLHRTCKEPIPTQVDFPPPENPDRLRVLLEPAYNGSLLHKHIQSKVQMKVVDQEIDLAHVHRVHDINYLMRIIELTKRCETPSSFVALDNDTSVSKETFKACRVASQTICTALDDLMKEDNTLYNAFVCIRPPGHHVGVSGAVDNEIIKGVSNGFCLFNNVCIAAAYARATYPTLARIAILDIDIHHGNGTQQVVEALVPSRHQQTYSLFNSTIENTTYFYKPWKDSHDAEHVFFASVHGYGSPDEGKTVFYPGSGKTSNVQVDTTILNDATTCSFVSPTIINVGLPKEKHANGYPWREAWRTQVFPKLCAFKPDFIFVSAGFDGHNRDAINRGFGTLNESDFTYIIEEILKISNVYCPNHVLCVLEGGYNIEGAGTGPLAQSVQSFVEGMIHSYYGQYDEQEWVLQSEVEKKEYDQLMDKKNHHHHPVVKNDVEEAATRKLMNEKYEEKKERMEKDDKAMKELLHQEENESEVEFDYEVDEEEDVDMEEFQQLREEVEDDEEEEEEEDEDDDNEEDDEERENEEVEEDDNEDDNEEVDEDEEEEEDEEDEDVDLEEEEEEDEEDEEGIRMTLWRQDILELSDIEEDETSKIYNPLTQNENGTEKTKEEQEQEQQKTEYIAGRSMRKRKTVDYVALEAQLKKEEEELRRKRMKQSE